MKLSKYELCKLLKTSKRLNRLDVVEVDNWTGYDIVISRDFDQFNYNPFMDRIDKLMANYKDYFSKESDNYNFV